MKITGILMEKGIHAFETESRVRAGYIAPRVWIILARKNGARIWRKGIFGFQEIASAEFKEHINSCDHHEYHEEYAAEKLSHWLTEIRNQDAFDRLVLVASKKMINSFRKNLPTDVLACISASIPKNLSSMKKNYLEEFLKKIIVI